MFQRNALAGVVMTMIVGLAVSAAAQTGFSDDIADYVWDLSSLCSSDAAFEDERAQVAAELDSIGRYRGTSSDGPAALAAALDAVSDLRGRAGKLYLYAALTAEIDITDERAQQRLDAASALEAQMTAAISFLRSEVLALGAETVGRWIDEHPAVARHKIRLLRILREGPYTRGPEAQEIIDGLERWPRMMIDFFDMINESGYCWPQVRNSDGETVTIDRVTFRRLRRETDTAFRDRAVSAYLQSLAGLEKFFGAVYTKRCEADLAIAQARNFASGIDAIWFLREQMPPGSHRTVIDVAHENIPLLRRYVRLRNRALGIAEPTYMDLYRQPANPGAEFPINRALQISCAALSVFGSEYQERLRGRIADGQLHLPPMENKRPTYGIFPAVADAKSYFLFSYQPTYRHARALAGGLLLLMAFSDIPSDLEPDSRDDPGIYSNGLIYVGDMLFDDQLLRETTATPERVALLLNALELLWNNFFEW
ncbi:MAG TPA: hypothetical protein VLB27_10970, partial [candidate division Zixibacteria bacterium]|nr:hypothetical protein [candidate division Zixibacteria bacterium]